MPRTDVHSPTNLVTEDYEFVGCGVHFEDGISQAPQIGYLIEQGWRFNDVHNAFQCSHCGAHLNYYAILKHVPSHTLIHVGETCLDNRFELASAEFHKLRKAAQLDRQAQKIKAARVAWLAEDADRQVAFDWANERVLAGDYGYDGFRHSFVSKVNRYGSTSDKFVAAILRDRQRFDEREVRKAEWAAQKAQAQDVPQGAAHVRGEVVSVKVHDGPYGSRLVMTVRDERGFAVWGSVPAAIDNVARGDVVEFDATLSVSDKDPKFGFFKRPRKAVLIEADEDQECPGHESLAADAMGETQFCDGSCQKAVA